MSLSPCSIALLSSVLLLCPVVTVGQTRPSGNDGPPAWATEFVKSQEPQWDPKERMLWGKVSNNGYHTKMTPGSPAHPVRSSFGYAVALLATGEKEHIARAEAVLDRILPLQVTDPTDPAFGVWPWNMEEPVAEMAPPDWNWADFCGSQIAMALADYSDRISPAMQGRMKQHLLNAAMCIFRRNVTPGYTNIAVMGGGVCAAAGELLERPELLAYGRKRLWDCVSATERDGGFAEFNSPAYTTIVIEESDRVLMLVKDPETRRAAERLRFLAWKTIAESYHPTTGQWAGPHSRAYTDYLNKGWANFIAKQVGIEVPLHPDAGNNGPERGIRMSPIPEELKERFRKLPSNPVEYRRRFFKRDPDSRSTVGVTWLSDTMTLGSVNNGDGWIQARSVLAYWKTDAAPAVLKLRVLHDGKPFASGLIQSAQQGPRALSLVTLSNNRGSHHPNLDRPADGVFRINSLTARYEVTGPGATVKDLGDGSFELLAAGRGARVTFGPGMFDGKPVSFRTGGEPGKAAWAEVVFYEGAERPMPVKELSETWATMGIALVDGDSGKGATPPEVSPSAGDTVSATWDGLSVTSPRRPAPK